MTENKRNSRISRKGDKAESPISLGNEFILDESEVVSNDVYDMMLVIEDGIATNIGKKIAKSCDKILNNTLGAIEIAEQIIPANLNAIKTMSPAGKNKIAEGATDEQWNAFTLENLVSRFVEIQKSTKTPKDYPWHLMTFIPRIRDIVVAEMKSNAGKLKAQMVFSQVARQLMPGKSISFKGLVDNAAPVWASFSRSVLNLVAAMFPEPAKIMDGIVHRVDDIMEFCKKQLAAEGGLLEAIFNEASEFYQS